MKVRFIGNSKLWSSGTTATMLTKDENGFMYVGFVSDKTGRYMENWVSLGDVEEVQETQGLPLKSGSKTIEMKISEFQELVSKIPDSSSPFVTSERQKVLMSLSKSPIVPYNKVLLNKPYCLVEGFGSIYKNLNSVGYFTTGTVVVFTESESDKVFAKMIGTTFKVTSDASFANQSATFRVSSTEADGYINLKDFPRVIDLDVAINVLSNIAKMYISG